MGKKGGYERKEKQEITVERHHSLRKSTLGETSPSQRKILPRTHHGNSDSCRRPVVTAVRRNFEVSAQTDEQTNTQSRHCRPLPRLRQQSDPLYHTPTEERDKQPLF